MSFDLAALRTRIDALDEQIQVLINERANCAKQIAEVKRAAQTTQDCYRPEREAQVLRGVIARNTGPLGSEQLLHLFREIMSACRALEQPLKIAFLGPHGTFTHAAALKQFGRAVDTLPSMMIEQIFRSVESGAANYGVVPVENSTEGVISHTLDMFIDSSLQICGEVELRIHHNLLGLTEDIAVINRVYAHEQSLGQCRAWLATHLAHAERVAVSSNAEAARRAGQEPRAAAIASDTAADIYGLKILAGNIEDQIDNTTRFLVIGPCSGQPSGKDKTSLLLSTRNRPGALQHLLTPFMEHGISLLRIESRPSRQGLWEYVFFIDAEGHAQQEPLVAVLKQLESEVSLLKMLGSYPCAIKPVT